MMAFCGSMPAGHRRVGGVHGGVFVAVHDGLLQIAQKIALRLPCCLLRASLRPY